MDLNSRRPPQLERFVRYSLAYLQSRAKPISPLKQSAYHSINSTQNSIQTNRISPTSRRFRHPCTGKPHRHPDAAPATAKRKENIQKRKRERENKHRKKTWVSHISKKKLKKNQNKCPKNIQKQEFLNMRDMCFFACRVVLNIFRAHPLPACNRCYTYVVQYFKGNMCVVI